jgi:putative transcriptional regulator
MIIVNLDVMMAKRKMSLNTLSDKVGITLANLSILKNNKAKAIRFSTLDAICKALDCQVSDILAFEPDPFPASDPQPVKSAERSHWNDYGTIIDPSNEF